MTIRLTDPTTLGPTVGAMRQTLGIPRRAMAAAIANQTGRNVSSVNSQLWRWDNGHDVPALASLRPVLAMVGCDLALIPQRHPGARDTGTGWPT